MPCYDPIPSKQNEMYPQWLCQAFKMLTPEQIFSINGICEGWSNKTAWQWYVSHIVKEGDLEEFKRLVGDAEE